MAVFQYNAIDSDASELGGTVTADTPAQARELLRDRGLTVTAISEAAIQKPRWFSRTKKHNQAEIISFIRETGTLLTAGIPLLDTLQTLSHQHKRRLRTVIQHLADDVASGSSLGQAMSKHDDCFDELSVSIVLVGENTGSLELALRRLAAFKEKAHRLRSKVTTAMIYPMLVGMVGLGVTFFLMTYVVPNLLSSLTQTGRPLPTVTMIVKATSDFLISWWWLLLLSVVAAATGGGLLLRTQQGRLASDRLKLKIPIFGELVRRDSISRIAVVLAALLRSGLPFVEAVNVTRKTVDNRVFGEALDQYSQAVTAGSDVSRPLAASGVFPPMVVQMLAVGQQSGQLEEMLEQLAEAYDQEVATAAQRFTTVLEPLLILALSFVVGFVAFATILPILEVSNVF